MDFSSRLKVTISCRGEVTAWGAGAAGHTAAVAGKQRAMKTCAQLTSPFPKGQDPSLGNGTTHSGTISIDQIKNKVLHSRVQILVCKGMVDHTKLAGEISHRLGQEGFPL